MAPVDVPQSTHTVDVHIFDTTFRIINGRPQAFMDPAIKGFDRMNALAYSFLITHRDNLTSTERRLLFDLGAPKDWKNDLPPSIADNVKKWERAGIRIECEKYVSEILEESGIPLESIEGMVWRYVLPIAYTTAACEPGVTFLPTTAIHTGTILASLHSSHPRQASSSALASRANLGRVIRRMTRVHFDPKLLRIGKWSSSILT